MEAIRKKLSILKEEKEQAMEDLEETKKELKEVNARADAVSGFLSSYLLLLLLLPLACSFIYFNVGILASS